MLATFLVQHHDDSTLTEFVTYERNSVYHIVTMLELNNNVKAYTIFSGRNIVEDPRSTYSFSDCVGVEKYTTQNFQW